ncbi:uncharacterized protein BXZ73DRAFT_40844 [Epithele typhae]|uniref:uncharacterized protein n=1 Tax=Epithele typhae TaxID=378194 RepID=UPI00200800C8|nr:uncharacterized protein BXZ73DRAFT_40844 [Epithele typhae]KAH9942131.1 hypothetical protein BXZ73DRAFT_40844 [Epithele typhae]
MERGPYKLEDLTALRHPDPGLVTQQEIKDPRLQLMGSWKKIRVKGIAPRQGFASFVWNSRLYVLGGEKNALPGPWYRDFHYIDLKDPEAGWRALPAYPVSPERRPPNARAYFLHGRSTLDVFDLRTDTWSQVKTKMAPGSGPWPLESSYNDFCIALVRRTLFVFGGTTNWALGGTCSSRSTSTPPLDAPGRPSRGGVQPDFGWPGPRKHAMMWADAAKEKLWMMYGEADRAGAMQLGQMQHAANESYVHSDCWSWDIARREWQQERINGNPPCPRAEAGVAHNEKLGKVVVFGGYNAAVPTLHDRRFYFHFSYYADTFVLETKPADNSPPYWRQVITRGWPTYRAQCKLVADPDTGEMYLFGGYTNSEYIKGRRDVITRPYGDLWQLRLDVPGGGFEDVDLAEETRSARAGPWRRCFGCGAGGPGAGLKKCAGGCAGKAVFCDAECLKQGWKEHKEKDKCKKL